jgi:murein DD-endopeptidase MepM/ murein hydrolase activator NlpD
MPVTILGPDDSLPRSHCFVSVAHGRSMRTLRLPTGVFWSGLVTAALLLLWLIASTLYLVFHDDLVASLMAREARMQYAYEDRIAALRGQVQHEASLALVGNTTIEGQVHELAMRAATLETRASIVADLAAKVGLGVSADARSSAAIGSSLTSSSSHGEAIDNPVDGEPTASITQQPVTAPLAGERKPRPEASLLSPTDPLGPLEGDGKVSLRIRLATIAETLEHVDAAQYDRLATIGAQARHRADTIRTALASAGLAAERFQAKADTAAMGGPFVPLDPAIGHSPFGHALDRLQSDVVSAEGLVRAMPRLPFDKPLAGAMEVTSPFGARVDPFLGRPAMHTGVDLRDDYGTEVRVTAAGRVVSAGPAGGYGNMIEIDHGHGLSTRYAHLSSIGVSPGQTVVKGEVIGEVGATGRATGPHLHYETRIDGEAVDPMRFLIAGEKLAALDPRP